jgi:aldehyde dehydrogenase (NAD+)
VTLIIGAWNEPYMLTLALLVAAIAAGNTPVVPEHDDRPGHEVSAVLEAHHRAQGHEEASLSSRGEINVQAGGGS